MDVRANKDTIVGFDGRVVEVFAPTESQQRRLHLALVASLELVEGRRGGVLNVRTTFGAAWTLTKVDSEHVGAVQRWVAQVRQAQAGPSV